ncbi:cyclase family protein [Candidatus Gracilibacteria bacterium]|nr:cyclase family protein [Candidatus Gracilibacteria bacterium]
MKIIDLSGEIYSGMPVFPGDPDVQIDQECTIENDEWNMKRIHINSHDSTHVNVPIHSKTGGKALDEYRINDFIGVARMYSSDEDIRSDEGLIFHEIDITWEVAQKIIDVNCPFIGLPSKFEFDIEIEKFLLKHDIISFERLENTHMLPKKFFFHGAPLKIREGDGSPVRAYAVIT